MVEIFVGGPYESVPPVPKPKVNANGDRISATFYKGHWYKRKLKMFNCPVCSPYAEVSL